MPDKLFEVIERLHPNDIRPHFDCGDCDLNEFFHADSIQAGKELMAVTYVARHLTSNDVLAYFSISNDSINKDQIPTSRFRRASKKIAYEKRYRTLPAVKIGRLATTSEFQSNGIGRDILDFLKFSFTQNNKTGCRFIIVDAANGPRTLKFYEKNEFKYLLTDDTTDKTRLMFYDLSQFKQ